MGKIFCYGNLQTRDLKALARGLQVSGYSRMTRETLISQLEKADPAGKCAKKADLPAAAAKPAPKTAKTSAPSQKSAPVKEHPAVKKEVPSKSSVSKSVSPKKGKVSKEPSVPKSAPSAAKKTPSKPAPAKKRVLPPAKACSPKIRSFSSGEEPAPKNILSEQAGGKKASSPAKTGSKLKGQKSSSRSARSVSVIPSKLRMGSAPPLKLTPPSQDAEKKSKRRRAIAPRREDVTVISMPSEESASFQEEAAKDILPANTLKDKMMRRKTLETPSSVGSGLDRIVLQVCGPFWLHAWWEISGTLISRVRAAMGHLWHTADPILRLYRVTEESGGRYTKIVGDYVIHGGVYNWFLNVDDPPGTFLVEIGYRSRDRQFFSLVSSNTVITPQNYIQESMGWSESAWNMLTASTMVSPFEGKAVEADLSPGAEPSGGTSRPRRTAFSLAVDAEVVIKGQTSPDAQLTVRGERIFLREDGTFLIRYHLPERRHVFPVAAVSRDGIDTKTIVLSVERNTKNLETVVRPQSDDD